MIKVCKCGKEFTAFNTIQNKCYECQALYGYNLKKSKQKAILPKKPKIIKPRVKSENKKWKEKAWKQFSLYIRYSDCLKTTNTLFRGVCYTCGKEFDFKGLQAGHCIGGRGNYVLLDEDLVNAQCQNCNDQSEYGKKGNYEVSIPKKIREHGLEWFEEKKRLSKIPIKKNWKEEYFKYKEKVEELVCSKNLPWENK